MCQIICQFLFYICLMKFYFLVLASCFTSLISQSQNTSQPDLSNEAVHFISGISENKTLKDLFSSKKITGLGEATHGTHDFFTVRSALTKFLIQECGYKTVLLESSFGSMLYINDYVVSGRGNIDSLLRKNAYWIYYTSEVKNFFNWLKEYNAGLQANERVLALGVDIQGLPEIPDEWLNTSGSLFTLQLKDLCTKNSKYIRGAVGSTLTYRDSCMAANVIDIETLTRSKIVLWAHNGHVGMADPIANHDYFADRFGKILDQTFGDGYYPIGFFHQQGKYTAMDVQKKGATKTYAGLKAFSAKPIKTQRLVTLLAKISDDPFFIDISKSSNPLWKQFHNFHMIGSGFHATESTSANLRPGISFKGLIFIRKTSPALQLDDFLYKTR